MEAKFIDDIGFNYFEFLKMLQPTIVEPAKYNTFIKELKLLNSQKQAFETNPITDIQSLIIKIKDQVKLIIFKQ